MTHKAIAHELPFLRRYARALTGSQQLGDTYVRHTLEALVANPEALPAGGSLRQSIYHLFHTTCWPALEHTHEKHPVGGAIEQTVQARFGAISPTARQALLLTVLEGFSVSETAIILSMTETAAQSALDSALTAIEHQSLSSVLIIEDEPMIAMELEGLVTSLGHSVVGNATTHGEAMVIFAESRPGLVLADIQLADGSSGINAVKDILQLSDTPVIFITAFPERLLTGERPEPTYLITKPFTMQAVKVAISQALFLNSTARPSIAA
jgi:CheY-like chemotaxis protein/DNA-directed RNA polymerase specialized sigma24 family protein